MKTIILTNKLRHLTLLLAINTLLFTGCNSGQEAKEDTSSIEKALVEAIEAFNTAFKTCDVEKLELLVTDNYIHTNGMSKPIGKSAWLEYLKSRRKEIESGNLVVNDYELQERSIEIFHDMAIVTGKIVTTVTSLNEEQSKAYRITNIWVKEGTEWKRAGFHDTEIK